MDYTPRNIQVIFLHYRTSTVINQYVKCKLVHQKTPAHISIPSKSRFINTSDRLVSGPITFSSSIILYEQPTILEKSMNVSIDARFLKVGSTDGVVKLIIIILCVLCHSL